MDQCKAEIDGWYNGIQTWIRARIGEAAWERFNDVSGNAIDVFGGTALDQQHRNFRNEGVRC